MDNIATVTDAYKAFQYAIATDINGSSTGIFEYDLQKLLGDVTGDGNVTIDDSFEFLMPSDINEQASIGNYFQKLNSLIDNYRKQIVKLKNIKQACLRKMFV